ncbi:hypothetical protein SAMN05216447_11130 [Parafannyhessea umbonata]|uniref:Uncharacterized protein n=1 Tax=Parafannyhessea umbonata TaxID=604330 RepID=A0A1H6K1V2_9ACTN|nr:hypothetical protein SAMN05216447_11130 [Parafannyhessea umbonata]
MGGGPIKVIPDMLFPDMKMVSECDGRAFHGFEDPCVSDRSRWRGYSLNGYSVIPVTYADLARLDSSDGLIESVFRCRWTWLVERRALTQGEARS